MGGNTQADAIAAWNLRTPDPVITAYEAALTPSEETKIAYMGEFTIPWPVVGEDGDDHIISIDVPWTTIKEIMAAIRERSSKGTQP